MMKVAIIDADLVKRKNHRFPNLACMKISAYHKQNGDDVTLKIDYNDLKLFDRIYVSKVFTDTEVPKNIFQSERVIYGGTGFFYDKAPRLDDEIEHIFPDYHLYDKFIETEIQNGINPSRFKDYTDFSIGFTTRGCIRRCKFCVNQNYHSCNKHSPVSEFLDNNRKNICLLDDNIFACKDWKDIFDELIATKKKFCFKQGMDERLLDDEKCDYLFNKSKYYGDKKFAFDNIKDRKIIESKLQLIREYTKEQCQFYTFCGFNHNEPDVYSDSFWTQDIINLFERIRILLTYNCIPYVMRYKDYELSPYRGMYVTIARWCNQPSFFKKKSFREFCLAHGENSSSVRYMSDFQNEHPDIASEYFDLRWRE